MRKLWFVVKRVAWVAIVGLMIAFHNTYQQEFKSIDDVRQEIMEEDEEE